MTHYVLRILYSRNVVAGFNWFLYFRSGHCVFIVFGAEFLTQLGSTSVANQYTTALRQCWQRAVFVPYWTVPCSRNYLWYSWWRSHCRFQRWFSRVWQHVCPNQCEGGMTVLSYNTGTIIFCSQYTVDNNHMLLASQVCCVACIRGRRKIMVTQDHSVGFIVVTAT